MRCTPARKEVEKKTLEDRLTVIENQLATLLARANADQTIPTSPGAAIEGSQGVAAEA